MVRTWYVTVEISGSDVVPGGRGPRETRTFETEREAKSFARAKFDEGLVVYAGTINPQLPKQHISSGQLLAWLDGKERR